VGIDVNGNANGVTVNNSTAYNNTRNWQFDENLATHVLRNNISLAGVNTTLSDVFFAAVDDAFNSWNPGVGTTTAADFVSLVDTLARGPRQADGSLPVIDFLHLLGNSDLIDKGTNVGLLYIGQAPDLGAFETAVDDFWRSAASGTWSAGLNWEDSSTPTASNTANFNESGTYTVTFDANPDAIRALIVSAGSVTFASSGGARTLPVNSAGGTGDVRIDGGATLTLGTSGNPLHLTIGDELAIESGATLNINHSSQVTPGGNVTVDGGVLAKDSATSMLTLGTGKTLTIENGGRASFTGGYSTNNAVYNVSGAASRMETLAGGTLSINNGAIVNVTAGGLLSSAGNLGVGTSGANGILLVDGSDSSVVASGTLNIWGASGGSASVTFSNNATGTFAGELRMTFPLGGGSPSASLHVLSGADVVVMDSISVASFGGLTSSATLNVQGAGSSLTQTDSLTIGHTSAGTAVVNVGTTDSGATFTNVDGPVTINATGTLSIGSATTSGTFDAGGAMTVLGTVNLAGGAMFARNTLTIDPAGDFNFTGGTLHAVEIVGSLASSGGTLEPGFSTAALTISGAYAQSAASKLRLELGGASPGSQFDHILVGGAATLAGALEISLVDSFAPGLGDSFEILHADGGVFGSFATSSLPPLPAALSWHVVYSASAVLLQVVLPGDYNDDGKVDAADYVVWRKNEGTTTPLPNDPIGGMIGLDQLNQWRANFGETGGSGAGSSINPAEATVPEPATLALLLAAVFVGYGLFAGRGSQCQIRFLS
jgi:hypothetical protein